jgi:hypothetical protein
MLALMGHEPRDAGTLLPHPNGGKEAQIATIQ